MSSSIAAASSIGVKANAMTRVSKRAVNSKPAVVCSASNKSDDVAVGSSQDAVTRRQALAAGAAVTATLGASTPALAGLLDGALDGALTLGGGDVKEKRAVNLPELQIEFISREDGYPLANGGEKGRAQQQYLKFIEPIIVDNIDLPYSEYMRLALHDAGTYQVVGKKNGANGSIRFELDRPENALCKKAFASIEKIKKAVDATVNQPISYADLIAIVPHFAARIQFAKDYYEVMGEDDPNYEFLFIGTNPYLGAKMRIGRKDADGPDPEGLVPGEDASTEDLVAWFKRMGLGPNQLVMFAPYMYEDPAKGLDLAVQDGTNAAVANQYESQRKLGKRAPGPAVTIIKKLKDMTDNCIPGGAPYVGGDRDPNYVEYAYIRGGGEIPRVTTFGAYPGSSDLGSSKFAQKVRGDR
uniref:Plant heme peroxidase family profile domain-containing protein n=1 Tax=Micromonas pusilla TaxID=38833 RepID=A0A7S0KGG2_MICPS|mmetsp:Transcript_1338/g.5058  ORF Transcript_1338/g.5058 Transcript_1338/m.5058 type:complete len:412 (+) Transcript_1338:60-1295(+)